MNFKQISVIIIFLSLLQPTFAQPWFFSKNIGNVKAVIKPDAISLGNNVLSYKWLLKGNSIHADQFKNKLTNTNVQWSNTDWFYVQLYDGTELNSGDFELVGPVVSQTIKANKKAIKKSETFAGKSIVAELIHRQSGLKIRWKSILKNGSNYIKQEFSFSTADSLRIDKIGLIQLPVNNNLTCNGVVAGSPITGNDMFFALEHPMSQFDTLAANTYGISIKRYIPLTTSELTFTAVCGVTAPDQLRRSFLYYLERERAVPYHHQLHYNSWYDISWVDRKMDEKQCLDRIQVFADSLIVKRNVKMDAFLFDDGWDNNQSLWKFNSGFPNEFKKLAETTHKYNANLGVWISPWGGYDDAKVQRLLYGQQQQPPFETNDNGFSLGGTNYYKRFFEVASSFVTKQGVSMFKFDGVGMGNGTEGANAAYEKDIDALLKLIPDLRSIKTDLYFSLTVGTWPSPYWLYYGDAIWRNGADTGLSGEGNQRQRWMNFRDAETYNNIVKRGPLYPLNSLMNHGICIADNGVPDSLEMNDKDIADEIWSYFGNGSALQELYVNPHKLNKNNWDDMAAAAKWAKANENILYDTHWVGGSPAESAVYGFASFNSKKGLLMLRNPSSQIKQFLVNTAQVFEIPQNQSTAYQFFDVRSGNKKQVVASGSQFQIELQPFEVKVLEARPQK